MGKDMKYIYTTPKQIPLFEELDDGSLEEYSKE